MTVTIVDIVVDCSGLQVNPTYTILGANFRLVYMCTHF